LLGLILARAITRILLLPRFGEWETVDSEYVLTLTAVFGTIISLIWSLAAYRHGSPWSSVCLGSFAGHMVFPSIFLVGRILCLFIRIVYRPVDCVLRRIFGELN
jgi:hypothetical protein